MRHRCIQALINYRNQFYVTSYTATSLLRILISRVLYANIDDAVQIAGSKGIYTQQSVPTVADNCSGGFLLLVLVLVMQQIGVFLAGMSLFTLVSTALCVFLSQLVGHVGVANLLSVV
eukprot:9471719-Pyramimonas_sp.AAC.2